MGDLTFARSGSESVFDVMDVVVGVLVFGGKMGRWCWP